MNWLSSPEAKEIINESDSKLVALETSSILAPVAQPLGEDELALTLGRVALSSAWLSTEVIVTNNLWFGIGTSALGLFAAMLVARAREINTTRPSLPS